MNQFLKLLMLFVISVGERERCLAQKPPTPLAGQALIDSLLKELPRQKEDTNKVKLLNKLSSGYWKIKPDEGIRYGQKSLELATKLDWEKGIAVGYNALGVGRGRGSAKKKPA